MIWDRAGERILNLARQRAEAVSPPEQRILIYKNNTDNKGNSYGTHENYLMDRKVPFARIVQHMMPFFVSRQVYTGAGKVGGENNAEPCDYQISQRADFLETEVGLETMHSRPIINTRDEPHADPEKYRRLHVIVGDANMSEVSTYLKMRHDGRSCSAWSRTTSSTATSRSTARWPPSAGLARPRLPRDDPAQGRAHHHRRRPAARVPGPGPPLLPRPRARAVGARRHGAVGARRSTGSPRIPCSSAASSTG